MASNLHSDDLQPKSDGLHPSSSQVLITLSQVALCPSLELWPRPLRGFAPLLLRSTPWALR